MIAWWWILIAVPVSIVVGIAIWSRVMVLKFTSDLKDENSKIRKMLDPILEGQDRKDAQMYARGAELYDETSKCLLLCGHEIAKMFLAVEEKRQAGRHGELR